MLQCIRDPLLHQLRADHCQKRKRSIMSAITVSSTGQPSYDRLANPRTSLLRRLFDRIVEARHREAQRRVAAYLYGLSDDGLARLGLSSAEIALIRAGTPIGEVLAQQRDA
jgi:hypothetical protein